MLECLWLVALLLGTVRAVRHGFAPVVAAGAGALYLLAADTLSAVGTNAPESFYAVFSRFILGPGASIVREAGLLPLPGLLLEQPVWTRGLRVAIGVLSAVGCLRRSSAINPLLPRAQALDETGLPFVGAAVIDGIMIVIFGFAYVLARDL